MRALLAGWFSFPGMGATAGDLIAKDAVVGLDYVSSSRGEWSVAKGGYVESSSGWFSCRSACYLAAGRPVIVQDTGFGRVIPIGVGVVAFSDIDEAAEAIREVEGASGRHATAAREIAHALFDSGPVFESLISRAMAP